jgi:hypothetical protein
VILERREQKTPGADEAQIMEAIIALLMELFSIVFLLVITFSVVGSVVTALRAVRHANARQATGRSHDLAQPPKPFGDTGLNRESKACRVA